MSGSPHSPDASPLSKSRNLAGQTHIYSLLIIYLGHFIQISTKPDLPPLPGGRMKDTRSQQ